MLVVSWISPGGGGANTILMVLGQGCHTLSMALFAKGFGIQQDQTSVNKSSRQCHRISIAESESDDVAEYLIGAIQWED